MRAARRVSECMIEASVLGSYASVTAHDRNGVRHVALEIPHDTPRLLSGLASGWPKPRTWPAS